MCAGDCSSQLQPSVRMKNSSWPPIAVRTLESQFLRLLHSVSDTEKVKQREDDDQIWLTRFLVARSSGFLEQVTYELVREYIRAKSGGLVRSFAHSWVERTRNPSVENLCALVGRFDGGLHDEFVEFLDEEDGRRRQDIALLVARRNDIAHGKNEGLNTKVALRLAATTRDVVDWLIRELNPERR